MRTIEVDQFEFDDPSTEEHLEIAVAERGNFPFPDVERFMSARLESVAGERPLLGDVMAFGDELGYGLVRGYLKRFAGVALPDSCSWPTYVLEDGPDRWEIVLCAPDSFVHYVWHTTA
ncbi:hypothetical protein [Dyella sp. ASV21]|uniref:hypothetical protein n=1 Tax=Dyella sp. ASV21 TaxID=2795114 RepID=UPI0018EC6B90|nr:hypothetical protein [Dyella sp. ASV21]